MSQIAVLAVSARRSVSPHSFKRFNSPQNEENFPLLENYLTHRRNGININDMPAGLAHRSFESIPITYINMPSAEGAVIVFRQFKFHINSNIKTLLSIWYISAPATIIFMYFMYYPGWQSIAAGAGIGTTIPLITTIYTNYIVRKFLVKSNLLILLTLNTIVHVVVIFAVAIFFVVIA